MNFLSNRIIDLRESKNWTQAELAKKMNLDKSIMNKIESGKRKVSTEELEKFSEIFNVTTDYLLGREEKKDNSIISHFRVDTADMSPEDIEELEEEINEFTALLIERAKRKIRNDNKK